MKLPATDYDFGYYRSKLPRHEGKFLKDIDREQLVFDLGAVKALVDETERGPQLEEFIAMVSAYLSQLPEENKDDPLDDVPW